jgi:hypothetical protein
MLDLDPDPDEMNADPQPWLEHWIGDWGNVPTLVDIGGTSTVHDLGYCAFYA